MRELIDECLKDKKIESRQDFLDILNMIAPLQGGWGIADSLSCSRLMGFTSAKARLNSYVEFEIPKKSGGRRKITAPKEPLKAIQSAINLLLQSIFIPSDSATGFVIGKSVKDNAEIHVGQTFVYNIDLENFFPSITKLMVRKAFIRELSDKIPSRDVINIICKICTVPDSNGIEVVPQGAPTSPVISNIVLRSMDMRMMELAEKSGCRYSRYADDITFSHSKSARKIGSCLESQIQQIIESYGLRINAAKTKSLCPGVRMEVTGITVNEKANVSRKYIRQLRTLIHLWEKYGYEKAKLIYSRDFCSGIKKSLCNVIKGKINYLEMIKGKEDSVYLLYKRKLRDLEWKKKQLKQISITPV